MTGRRTSVLAVAWMLAGTLAASAALAARKPAELQLPAGARIGLVTVLDAEVTHFHASRQVQSSFLKTYPVRWQVSALLADALREPLTHMGFAPVVVDAGEALTRAREECFLNAALDKDLSKDCAAPYTKLAAAQHLDAIIILGPGLNDSTHANGARRKQLPEYLRGWCVVTGGEETGSAPTLLNLTELLLIGLTPKGALIVDREWGGATAQAWSGYAPPPDPKAMPEAQFDQLRPLFAGMLKLQASALLAHLH